MATRCYFETGSMGRFFLETTHSWMLIGRTRDLFRPDTPHVTRTCCHSGIRPLRAATTGPVVQCDWPVNACETVHENNICDDFGGLWWIHLDLSNVTFCLISWTGPKTMEINLCLCQKAAWIKGKIKVAFDSEGRLWSKFLESDVSFLDESCATLYQLHGLWRIKAVTHFPGGW